MEFINNLIDNNNIPLLSAFFLGVLTAISPCPLATNITAIAFISGQIKTAKNTMLNGFYYTLGRGISYTVLATLIYFGMSSFSVASIFKGWGDKVLGPVLILIGLIMFGVIKVDFGGKSQKLESIKIWLAGRGYIGSLLLGVLFALAFCPYSGVIFFGMLIPLIVGSSEGWLLPLLFASGTGLPVIIFSILIAFSLERVGRVFHIVQKIEKVTRYLVAAVFVAVGLYYLYLLGKYLLAY